MGFGIGLYYPKYINSLNWISLLFMKNGWQSIPGLFEAHDDFTAERAEKIMLKYEEPKRYRWFLWMRSHQNRIGRKRTMLEEKPA